MDFQANACRLYSTGWVIPLEFLLDNGGISPADLGRPQFMVVLRKEHDDSPGDLVAYFQTIARSDLSIYSALIVLNRKAWRKLRDLPLLAHNFFRNTSTNEGSNN